MKIALVVILVVLLLGGCSVIGMRNSLVTLDENVNNAWAQVDTVLQRRYDLIPNLVASVKGYAEHEKGILEEVTRLRSQWGEAKTPNARAEAASQMEGALGRLMLVAESYPNLKANENFRALMDELSGTENRISVERRRYNDVVKEYNATIRRFPMSTIAGMMNFEKRSYFEAAQGAEVAPKVEF
jgi:LemA protein